MGDFTSEKEQKLLESEAEVSNTEDTNADELTFEETSGFSDDDDDSEEEEKKPKKKFTKRASVRIIAAVLAVVMISAASVGGFVV